MQLSIIVPVYNVEPYLEKCIRSLMAQDMKPDNYEVIVINDGSPDNSIQVVHKLRQEFSNIILIDQENEGVSLARNNGIKRATGKYILCVDPDDYILSDTLQNAVAKAVATNLDVLYLSFTILGELGDVEYTTDYANLGGQIFSGPDTYFKSRGARVRDPDRSVGILYKAEFIRVNQLAYPKDVPYLEDGLFLAKVLCLASHCVFDSTPFYQRTTRPGSATHSRLILTDYARAGFIKAANEIRDFGQQHLLKAHQQTLINQAIAKFVLLPLQSCILDRNKSDYKKIASLLDENGFTKLSLAGCMSIYSHLGNVYNWSIWLLYYYYPFFVRSKKLL
jgi:glycosyltransferase involved in cell wall biosynthesis